MAEPLSLLITGAHGDLISILPMLRKWDQEGRRARVIVSPTYASVLEGVNTCEVQVMDGAWTKHSQDRSIIERATRNAVMDRPLNRLTWLSPLMPGQTRYRHRTTSFITWMWQECGELPSWDTLPLVFDNRSPVRESALAAKFYDGRPLILLATTGMSSPFPKRNQLYSLVSSHFPECQVLDMSSVRAERIYDLLGLMDKASCLVAIDTSHWHLAQASNVPTIALAQDSDVWKGSPMSRRHLLHVRYKDFESRSPEIIHAIGHALDGTKPLTPVTIAGLPHGSYNPSTIPWGNGWLMAYRFHPEPGNWRTQLGMALLDSQWRVERVMRLVTPGSTGGMSCEDPRLFVFNGRPWVGFTLAKPDGKKPKCVSVYGPLSEESGGWRVTELRQPAFGSNNWSGLEKNWVPMVVGNQLQFIYSAKRVITVDGDTVVGVKETEAPHWPWGDVHGGTAPLPHSSGLLLRFFHSRDIDKHRPIPHRYHIGAMLMDPVTWKPVKVSRYPIISGNELLTPCLHYKPNVVFPSSATEIDGGWRLTLGVNDSACNYLDLNEYGLNL